MEFEFEIYVDEHTLQKSVFITAKDGASGAEYPYETAEDIGKAIAKYLDMYYPEMIATGGQCSTF